MVMVAVVTVEDWSFWSGSFMRLPFDVDAASPERFMAADREPLEC